MRNRRVPLLLILAGLLLPVVAFLVYGDGGGGASDEGAFAAPYFPPPATATASPALDRAEFVDRVDVLESALPGDGISGPRGTPEGAIRDYLLTAGSFDYRGLSNVERRVAELRAAAALIERSSGPARQQLLLWVAEYSSGPPSDPAPNWLWRQSVVIDSVVATERDENYARLAVAMRSTRWHSGGDAYRVLAHYTFELHRNYEGIWRMAGWEAVSETLLPLP